MGATRTRKPDSADTLQRELADRLKRGDARFVEGMENVKRFPPQPMREAWQCTSEWGIAGEIPYGTPPVQEEAKGEQSTTSAV